MTRTLWWRSLMVLGFAALAATARAAETIAVPDFAWEALAATNAAREAKKLPPLSLHPLLMQAAQAHSNEQARRQMMAHDFGADSPAARVRATGYDFQSVGENVAANHKNAAEAVAAWMDSPGHRANILDRGFTELGVGMAYGQDGVPYWTQVFARPWPRETTGGLRWQEDDRPPASEDHPSPLEQKAMDAVKNAPEYDGPFVEYEVIQGDAAREVLRFTNAARAAAGLSPLTLHPLLTKAARRHSEQSAPTGAITHVLNGKDPGDRLHAVGYDYQMAGENVAYNTTTPREVVNGWMHSPGHRANILNRDFTEMGLGLAFDAAGHTYWTQKFAKPVPTPRDIPPQEAPGALQTAINAARAELGLPALTLHGQLNAAAQGYATVLAAHGWDSAEAKTQGPTHWMQQSGYPFRTWAADVGSGFESAQDTVTFWLARDKDRATLLRPTFTQMGAAIAFAEDGIVYWVVVYAKPK